MGLKTFYRLIDHGKSQEAFLTIETLQGEDMLEGELIRALLIGQASGDYEQFKPLIEQIIIKTQKNPLYHSFARTTKAYILESQAKHEEALEELELAQKAWDELELIYPSLEELSKDRKIKTQYFQAWLWTVKAYLHFSRGYEAFPLVLQLYSQSLDVALKPWFPTKLLALLLYNDMSVVYERLGEWSQAIDCHNKALAIGRNLGNRNPQVYPLIKLGNIYHIQGDLNLALKYMQEGLEIAQKINAVLGITRGLTGIGSIYHSKGEFEKALDYYSQSLAVAREMQIIVFSDLSAILWNLCLLHLDLNKIDQARKYLAQLQTQIQIDKSPDIRSKYLLAKALILKTSKRFKEKAQAQDLLKEVFEDNSASQRTRFLAMLHLCDLLLQEVKTFEDEALLQEVLTLSKKLIKLTHTWQFTPDLIKTLVLQAKLATIEGDINSALELLEQAHEIAEEKKLINLINQVKSEQLTLKKELNKWQALVDRNASLQERIAFIEIKEYLREAIKIRDLTQNTRP
ncbi:MAG: tetratricopeptide repeat protein [Candidatus Heimdallarchaeota archaeon]|nr:MAG: tetratricopeptide repeat protein [Candidatus Heimdallarchaeota archaeon]